MIEDKNIYEPLNSYRDQFREKFKENTERFFAELTEQSGIDVTANAATVKNINTISEELEDAKARRSRWSAGISVAITIAVVLLLVAIKFGIDISNGYDTDSAIGYTGGSAAGIVGLLLLIFKVLRPGYKRQDAVVNDVQQKLEEQKAIAWEQMASLNALYEWDAVANLVEKTVPQIQFDPYFTEGRLQELIESFGWNNSFNDGKSVLCSQSGEISGNPFVFGQTLQMDWGMETYEGSRTVTWTETVRDSKGNSRLVTRSQTLTATVSKPKPFYYEDKFLIYGNDAAPNLTFSREPSELSGNKDGFWAKRKLNHEIKKLEKFSRNLDDESNYTIMGNREFEALFHAVDRSDEIEFRLLFTPHAQRQMLLLLNDKEVGFGDDFSFAKKKKINIIQAAHLSNTDIDTNPEKFADFDFENAKRRFCSFCEDYFKATYFAFAPLLTIPLYQQMKSHATIYKDILAHRSSFWEHEAIANYLGENRFKHAASVTRNILKTNVIKREDDVTSIAVTAYGFRTEDRVDIVRVTARNGRTYDVSVHWDEYLPVEQTTNIHSTEREGLKKTDFHAALQTNTEWQDFFRKWGSSEGQAAFRRSIITF